MASIACWNEQGRIRRERIEEKGESEGGGGRVVRDKAR